MIGAILRLIAGRTIARSQDLPMLVEFLTEYLKEQGFLYTDRIPESVNLILLEEALRRAAEKEKDGKPRSNELLNQARLVAGSIIAVFNGDADADPRIKSILVFHEVLPEEVNLTSQPKHGEGPSMV